MSGLRVASPFRRKGSRVGTLRSLVVVALVLASIAPVGVADAGADVTAPRVTRQQTPAHAFRLVTPTRTAMGYGYGNRISGPMPVFIGAYGQGLEVEVHRDSYAAPVAGRLSVLRDGVRTTTDIPRKLVRGFGGFHKGVRVVVRDPSGAVVARRTRTWCPNGYERQRLDPDSVPTRVYPYWCSRNPFTRGGIWGIEQGWATPVLDFLSFRGTGDRYDITVKLTGDLARLLRIPKGSRSASFSLDVQHEEFIDGEAVGVVGAARTRTTPSGPATGNTRRALPVTDAVQPAPETLPDLISLPAFAINASHSRKSGKDRLNFAANEWNAGPGPMVVEGYRRGTRPVMDAYQVFYNGDDPVVTKRTGTMEFHDAMRHQHWHFRDFARYDLVDARDRIVATSGKQSWCLAPTDAIDLTVPNATWIPDATGLTSTCGGPAALWIRETMPVGWGDTYSQYQTQAMDITDLPNGTYWIRVTVNPKHDLIEVTTANNVSRRKVIISGEPGARLVRVPPFQGIDTERPRR